MDPVSDRLRKAWEIIRSFAPVHPPKPKPKPEPSSAVEAAQLAASCFVLYWAVLAYGVTL